MYKNPTSSQLALRDPAAAAAFGVMPGSDVGADFGNDWAGDVGFGADMGFGYGAQDGMDAGFGAAAPAAHSVPRPTEAQAMALWHRHHMQAAHTARRESLIDPNKHSTIKIEKYVFPLNLAIVFGTVQNGFSMSSQPDTKIRPIRVTTNAPVPMMILLTEIKVANVSVTVGAGNGEDAFAFNANGQGQEMSLPTLEPSNKATVLGNYGGLTPPGFLLGGAATFVVSFKGPSTMAG